MSVPINLQTLVKEQLAIVYDGQCPLCSDFAGRSVLGAKGLVPRLIDARTQPELVSELGKRGIDINQSFVVIHKATILSGAAAAQRLASLLSDGSILSSVYRRILNSQKRSEAIYPVLACGRRLLLLLLGRKPI